MITAYLGIWLFGELWLWACSSALTENQVIAGFLSMSVLFPVAGRLRGQRRSEPRPGPGDPRVAQAHYATSFLVGVICFEDAVSSLAHHCCATVATR